MIWNRQTIIALFSVFSFDVCVCARARVHVCAFALNALAYCSCAMLKIEKGQKNLWIFSYNDVGFEQERSNLISSPHC